jgi:Ca-activated chloride channel family protein
MRFPIRLNLRFFRFFPLPLLLLLFGVPFLLSQAQRAGQPQSAAQPQSAQNPAWDPTHPEIQPPLDVDRDPIPSPDVETPPPAAANEQAPVLPGTGVQKGRNGMYVYEAHVDEVLLDCTVINEKGETVTDLTQKDFRVWEDGVPQTINSVEHEDAPVSIGILVDNSGSMRDKRAAVNAAAYKFLQDSNPADETFVVNFSDRAYLDQGFTSSLTALDRGLSRFDSRGYTAMYDAVAAAADELNHHGKRRNQVLLIITDGADDASRLTLQQAIRRVQNLGGPVVYTIGLIYEDNRREADEARNALQTLSDQTGGVAYFPRSLQEVGPIAAQVAHAIREQYVVDYHSSNPFSKGGYRTVHVEASARGHGRLYVRTKRGYYAEQESKSLEQAQAR